MNEISTEAAKAWTGPELVEERYAEVRGAVDRLTNQIASAEVAVHELGLRVALVTRPSEPTADKPSSQSPTTGVELADILEAQSDRVSAIDSYLRSLTARIAL